MGDVEDMLDEKLQDIQVERKHQSLFVDKLKSELEHVKQVAANLQHDLKDIITEKIKEKESIETDLKNEIQELKKQLLKAEAENKTSITKMHDLKYNRLTITKATEETITKLTNENQTLQTLNKSLQSEK